MINGSERDFDLDDDIAAMMSDEDLIETSLVRKAKNDKHSRIRKKIEDLLDQKRLAEEFMPFDDDDY
jgi:hypothetical protein